jgi:transketolase
MSIIQEAKLAANWATPDKVPTRFGFGDGLVIAGDRNPNVMALCCDLTESVRMHLFRNKYPSRYIEMGIAEQNMASLAAGLSSCGKVPFIGSYAVFSPGRNWDQIRVSVCYSNENVKVVGCHAGLSVGPDGATHQGLEDVAIMRVLPGMTVLVPCDSVEAKKITLAAAELKGPVYFRLGREPTPVITTEETPFQVGKVSWFRDGKDVAIIACGQLVYDSLMVAEELAKEGIDAVVINCHTIKPLDNDGIIAAARKCNAVVTVEEHQVTGGLGGAVAELLSENYPVPIKRVGMPDSFGGSGQPEELMQKFGLTKDKIKEAVKAVVGMKR